MAGPEASNVEELVTPSDFERRQEKFEFRGFVGASPAMDRCFNEAKALAPFPAPVLIFGDTGVGKRELANAMHKGSGREGKLITADCSQVPQGLMADTLFGHTKGAFTGAVQAQNGLIHAADGGTLFLDEVENLPPDVQQMLLMVLDSKNANMRVRPLGRTDHQDFSVRLICATNADLEELVKQGKFREDLFYRISTLQVRVPALRARGADYIHGLMSHILQELHRENFATIGLNRPVMLDNNLATLLAQFDWPGNIRELTNVLYQACINAVVIRRDSVIRMEDLPNGYGARISKPNSPEGIICGVVKAVGEVFPPFDEVRRSYLLKLMEATHGNVLAAARVSGLSPRTVSNYLERFGISANEFRSGGR